jgi:hypothetical protein
MLFTFHWGTHQTEDDSFLLDTIFLSSIAFHTPSPIKMAPSSIVKPAVRSIPPVSSEERLARAIVMIIPTIIKPPLIKSNDDIFFEGSFLPIIKPTIDIITATPPNAPPRISSSNGKKPFPRNPAGELI